MKNFDGESLGLTTDACSFGNFGDVRKRIGNGHLNLKFTKQKPVASGNILLVDIAGFSYLTKGPRGFGDSASSIEGCSGDGGNGPPAHQALVKCLAVDNRGFFFDGPWNVGFVGEAVELCHGLGEVSIYRGVNSGSYLPFS